MSYEELVEFIGTQMSDLGPSAKGFVLVRPDGVSDEAKGGDAA